MPAISWLIFPQFCLLPKGAKGEWERPAAIFTDRNVFYDSQTRCGYFLHRHLRIKTPGDVAILNAKGIPAISPGFGRNPGVKRPAQRLNPIGVEAFGLPNFNAH
jgi:hypothetical protein